MRQIRICISFLLLLIRGAVAGPSTTIAHLPNTTIHAVKVDASGNIYIAGFLGDPATPDSTDAFVTKLSGDGSKILYSTKLGGSKRDSAVTLDIDSTGAAYVAGETRSPDFPVTPGVLQTTIAAPSVQGFIAKLDPQGKLVFASFLGGNSDVSPSRILINSSKEVILAGSATGANFPAMPGVLFIDSGQPGSFVLKLDANGTKITAAVRGVGSMIALDDQGSVYTAGIEYFGNGKIPVTPGAFQSTKTSQACGGVTIVAQPCSYQWLMKLNASLTQIVYATYLNGTYGASHSAMFVDSQRNLIVAGTTHSSDFPTTSNAFQQSYVANKEPFLQMILTGSSFGPVIVPPEAGYVAKLNATGTGLLYSTFFSGTQTDTISFAEFTSDGIFLTGKAGSSDLPGLSGFAQQCLPQTYATRLSLDGSAISATRIVPSIFRAYDPATKTLILVDGPDLIRFDPSAPPAPIACIVDAADLRPVTAVAPGELLSIFGAHFIDSRVELPYILQRSGSFITSESGVTVKFNGIAAPLVYLSPTQINVQAPFELAPFAQATMELTSERFNQSESRTLPVIARNPVAFIDTVASHNSADCRMFSLGFPYSFGPIPIAFNSDGSRNSCFNPASSGSVVRLFLSGLGLTTPTQATGVVNKAPGTPLDLLITLADGSEVSATALPGAISGVWEVGIPMPQNRPGTYTISISVDSVPVRDTNLTIWLK